MTQVTLSELVGWERPRAPRETRVGIVGAGLAGLTTGRLLREAGCTVAIFDKGRGPGGRIATRRRDDWQFDHGAQFFRARDPAFQAVVQSLEKQGVVTRWQPRRVVLAGGEAQADEREEAMYIGTPRMSALTRALAESLDVRCEQQATAIRRHEGAWYVGFEDGPEAGPFDILLLTCPARQTAALLDVDPGQQEIVKELLMYPCWTLMLGFPAPLPVDFDAAVVHGSVLQWLARNGSKPGRPEGEAWVAHARNDWAAEHLEREPEDIAGELLAHFRELLGVTAEPAFVQAHRWRYAWVQTPLNQACLWHPHRALGAAGDWCLGPRLECAFLSGKALAAAVLGL